LGIDSGKKYQHDKHETYPLPPPSLPIITGSFGEQSTDVGQLVLKHGLDTLLLRFNLAMQLLALCIQLLLERSNLVGLLARKLIELVFHQALLVGKAVSFGLPTFEGGQGRHLGPCWCLIFVGFHEQIQAIINGHFRNPN
jgi:hypothetical protein